MKVMIEWRDQDGCLLDAIREVEVGEKVVISPIVCAFIEGMRTETVASEISFEVIG
jgi:hypothetical protein